MSDFSDFDWASFEELTRRIEWTKEWFGEKCPDYDPNCIQCRVWKNLEDFEDLLE